jgi:hypothetical protein
MSDYELVVPALMLILVIVLGGATLVLNWLFPRTNKPE